MTLIPRKLTQSLSRYPALIGWPGGLGIAMTGAATIMVLTLSLPIRNETVSLNNEIKKLEPLLRQPVNTSSAAEIHKRLDAFVKTLPDHDTINDTLNQLHDLAANHHLTLKNSDYRPEQTKAGSIGQLRIVIKMEGEYADIRGFLREIPQTLPALAVEQLSLTRQKISDTKLDTVVEFALFYSQSDVKRT